MAKTTGVSDTMYNILQGMGQDAEFLYDTIDKFIQDAQKVKNQELADIWNKIKDDRLDHLNALKGALEKEIHAE